MGVKSNGASKVWHPTHARADDVVHFRPRRKRQPPARAILALNLAPMIDVTFLLLIFFLITTTFDSPEGVLASKLPRDTGPAVPLPLSPIVVRLTPAGSEGIGCAIRLDNVSRIPADFNELAAVLAEIQERPGFDDETPVVIMAGATMRWDHVVNCWNAAVRVKYKNIMFGEE